jgi:ABC-type proline/glycine betaine transport system ATPase subunit
VGDRFSIIINGGIAASGTADEVLASKDPFVTAFLEDIHEHAVLKK